MEKVLKQNLRRS